MNCADLAKILMATPNAAVLIKTPTYTGTEWVEVWGVVSTGQHRNAVTLDLRMPGGGVVVVDPDAAPHNPRSVGAVDPRQFDKTKEKCDQCINGRVHATNPGECEPLYVDCPKCKGTGYVDKPKVT